MKNILFLFFVFYATSCGSKNNNQVNSGDQLAKAKNESIEVANFEGVYDLRGDQIIENCPASINIIRECDGYILKSNTTDENEDFCNVNVNRRPPSPDGAKKAVVTQEGNQLTSVLEVGQNIYTNSLTLEESIYLTKVSNYKGRNSVRCYFEKR